MRVPDNVSGADREGQGPASNLDECLGLCCEMLSKAWLPMRRQITSGSTSPPISSPYWKVPSPPSWLRKHGGFAGGAPPLAFGPAGPDAKQCRMTVN
jgi:hypothetical protein